MGRIAQNVVAATTEALKKRVREGKGKPQCEWRVDKVPGLVLKIRPTGVGVFYLFYRNELGTPRKLRIGEFGEDGPVTLADARSQALALRAKVGAGGDPIAERDTIRDAATFQELAERFLAESPTLSNTTRKVYGYTLRKDVYPFIGQKPAGTVTADDVLSICKRIEKSNAMTQSERTKTTIGGVYRWALREREAGVAINPAKDIGRRSSKVARSRTPSDAEIATLWEALDNAPKLSRAMKLIVKLAVTTGQRRNEVAGARASEFVGLQTDAPRWIIPGDVNKRGKIIEGRTKNGREQHVPLSRQAADLFREAVRECSDGEFIFPADMTRVKNGKLPRTPHINGESVTMSMRRLREGAGIDDISIHDMRRAVSNWLKDEGVSREVRDLILNHKDSSVTEEHYSSGARMERQVRAALQAWADHIWQITGQATAPVTNVVELASARA